MNLQYETINFEIFENIAIIRLNRPNSYNSLNAKMAKELLEISYECDTNNKIRAIILTGEGEKAFCAGGDLKSFYEAGNIGKHLQKGKSTKFCNCVRLSLLLSKYVLIWMQTERTNTVGIFAGILTINWSHTCAFSLPPVKGLRQ